MEYALPIRQSDQNQHKTLNAILADIQRRLPVEGEGSPEGAVEADVGKIYIQTDGGVSTTLWIKETGSGDTGWTAK